MKFMIGLGIVLVLLLGFGMTGCSIRSREIDLRRAYLANEKAIQTAHDNMWKTISQKYELSNEWKDGFIAVINAAVEGRKGGALFKSVQENMNGLPDNVVREVMATVEGKRDMLTRQMNQGIDKAREHNAHVEKWNIVPFSMFLASTEMIDAKIITSGRTNQAWESGEDNDVSLKKSDEKKPAKAPLKPLPKPKSPATDPPPVENGKIQHHLLDPMKVKTAIC